jgi:hypothetical protein
MVLFVRTLSTKLGKYQQATELAKKVAVMIKTKYNKECQLYVQNAGSTPVGTIYFVVRFDNYSDFENTMNEFGASEEYLKAVENISEFFLSGTTFDSFLEPIPIED